MKLLKILSLFIAFAFFITACGSGGGTKGACIPKANPYGCGNDFTSGECKLINGTFYPGKLVSDKTLTEYRTVHRLSLSSLDSNNLN